MIEYYSDVDLYNIDKGVCIGGQLDGQIIYTGRYIDKESTVHYTEDFSSYEDLIKYHPEFTDTYIRQIYVRYSH
jgi:hypothetical protein